MPTTKKVASKLPAKKAAHVLTVRAAKTTSKAKSKKFTIINNKQNKEKIAAKTTVKAAVKTTEKVESFFARPEKSVPIIRPQLSLALLSPFRFPINTDNLALSTARYGGVFFMAIGALFTLFFANGSFGSVGQQVASVESTQTTTNTPEISANCEDSLQYESSACSTLINKKPPISFEVVGSPTSLVGTVSVHATVAHAKHVTLVAYSQSLKKVIEVGSMSNVSTNVWEFSWNTTALNDGNYKLKAYVQNFYGVYDTSDTRIVTIDNVPLQTDASSASASTTSTTVSQNTADEGTASSTSTSQEASARLELVETKSANQFRFKITAPLSTKSVKLYVQSEANTNKAVLGYAYKATDNSWFYRFDTSSIAEGTYDIKAVAIQTDAVQLVSNSLSVTKGPATVENTPLIEPSINASTTTKMPALKPAVTFDIKTPQALKGIATLKLDVTSAKKVELYAQSRSSLIKKFLGQAISIDTDVWMYQLDTKKLPNGEYVLIANVQNQYGTYESQSVQVKVQNEIPLTTTPKEAEHVQVLTDIAAEVKKQEVKEEQPNKKATTALTASSSTDEPSDIEEETADSLLVASKGRVDLELQLLASALRAGDTKSVENAKARLETLKKEIVAKNIKDVDTNKLLQKINTRVTLATNKVEADVQKTSKIIAERTSEKASQDSDKDGITDYDEIAIYKTNPFKVDTDNDGFNDGAEILSNHNPTDATAEALVVFESPQETGIVREDILEVKSIATALQDGPKTDSTSKSAEAIITGKALPNSFVTLYIFSTPIVVTLKTDSDGSWNYRFDKELEDGEHQVYVGVTDNAGKIVAKSKPFAFVKVAEAFSPVTGEANVATPVATPEKSFLSEYMIYLVLSISVVAIGLVLILLGLHLDTRQRKYGIQTEGVEKPA